MQTVTVVRTPYIEQANGDLTCSITIPFSLRALVLMGDGVKLSETPFSIPSAPAPIIAPEPPQAPDETFTASLDEAETATPPTQSIAPGGNDMATVLGGEAFQAWQHPAARFIQKLYLWHPFQQYALHVSGGDAFAAPMPTAVALIRYAVSSTPGALEGLEKMLDAYETWAKKEGEPLWPPANLWPPAPAAAE